MMSRRGRPLQVRPRPPSSGRPRPPAPVPRRPAVPRIPPPRGVERSRGLPIAAKAALGVAVVALVAVVLLTVAGALPRIVSTVGGAVSGIAGAVLPSPSPSPTLAVVPTSPVLDAPAQVYTNQPSVTVSGSVPASVVGQRAGVRIRLYVAVAKQEPVQVRDVALGETPNFAIPEVALQPGRNDFTATVVGPGGESEASPIVTYVLDTTKPKVTIASPADKSTVNGTSVTIAGKTQGRSTVTARNEANGHTGIGVADGTGSFQVVVALADGTNAITLTVVDPAGNATVTVLTVRRGTGQLKVALTASSYRISAARLPRTLELRAVATDPEGNGLPGRDITFTLSIPGVPLITGQGTTDETGVAIFRTPIPAGATPGSGPGLAFLTTPEYGDASGRVVITIIP